MGSPSLRSTGRPMSDAPPIKITHRPLLDGTRGVMMCVVLGYHLDGFTKLPGAWVSMDFFFVLSGYLITTLLVKEYSQKGRLDLRTFFRRRVRRLGPALLATLAGVFLIAAVLGGAAEFPGLRTDGIATLFYVANWRFIFSATSYFSTADLSPLRHAWSLAIEEQFYLIWPIAFLGLAWVTKFDKKKMFIGLGVMLAASALWMRHLSLGDVDLSRAYYGTDTRGQGLIVGSMMALVLWHERWDTPKARAAASWIGSVALVGLVTMMVLFSDDSRSVYTRGGFLLITVTAAFFIFGCARAERGPLAWIFGNPVSRHMGFVSYSFYLWHWPIIVFMSPERLGWTPWLLDTARVLVALALAEATYWFLERPIHQQRWALRRQGPVLGGAFAGCLALLVVATMGPVPEQLVTSGGGERASGGESGREVMVLGDSLAWLLAGTAPEDYSYKVEGTFIAHCDISGDRIFTGSDVDVADPLCPQWPDRWTEALTGEAEGTTGDPDAILVSLGLRQLFDIEKDGTRLVVGTPEWEQEYRSSIDEAVTTIRATTDAPVLWLDVPCYRWDGAETDGEEADADRMAVVNEVLADELDDEAGFELVPYSARVCDGTETDDDIRPDGAHLTPEASADLWRDLEPRFDQLTEAS